MEKAKVHSARVGEKNPSEKQLQRRTEGLELGLWSLANQPSTTSQHAGHKLDDSSNWLVYFLKVFVIYKTKRVKTGIRITRQSGVGKL